MSKEATQSFLKDLSKLMDEYGIHRIYEATNNNYWASLGKGEKFRIDLGFQSMVVTDIKFIADGGEI